MLLHAFAKLNLTLDILNKRPDGYHSISSVMQSISLFDVVNIAKSDTLKVSFKNPDIDAENSTALKAARAFFSAANIKSSAQIYIENNIPLSSGMGGGSADAAAVLVGLNKLYKTGFSNADLINIGKTVGADIPFCIVGGTAKVTGIGEIVEPITPLKKCYAVILKNGIKPSTAYMYNELDKSLSDKAFTDKMVCAIKNGDRQKLSENISNAFLTVCDKQKELKILKDLGAYLTGLTGSGPTVYGFFTEKEKAKAIASKLKENGFCAFYAETEDVGVREIL